MNNHDELIAIKHILGSLRCLERSQVEQLNSAINTLDGSEVSLLPNEINHIYHCLQINDSMNPKEMNDTLITTDKVAVVYRKFFDETISRTRFRFLIEKIISYFSSVVSGNILGAIVDFIDSISLIYIFSESSRQDYKEVCFKFFTPDENRSNLLVLVINIDFKGQGRQNQGCFCFHTQVHLDIQFFGAITRVNLE